jgi:hypothetical protein
LFESQTLLYPLPLSSLLLIFKMYRHSSLRSQFCNGSADRVPDRRFVSNGGDNLGLRGGGVFVRMIVRSGFDAHEDDRFFFDYPTTSRSGVCGSDAPVAGGSGFDANVDDRLFDYRSSQSSGSGLDSRTHDRSLDYLSSQCGSSGFDANVDERLFDYPSSRRGGGLLGEPRFQQGEQFVPCSTVLTEKERSLFQSFS